MILGSLLFLFDTYSENFLNIARRMYIFLNYEYIA